MCFVVFGVLLLVRAGSRAEGVYEAQDQVPRTSHRNAGTGFFGPVPALSSASIAVRGFGSGVGLKLKASKVEAERFKHDVRRVLFATLTLYSHFTRTLQFLCKSSQKRCS